MGDAMQVLHFSDADFEAEVLKSSVPVLVDFTATWCGPCRALAPLVEEAAGKFAGRVKVGKVDVDECPKTATKYQIRGVPTLLLFKDGQVAAQSVGLIPRDKLTSLLEKVSG
ncbi:MAG: thioredoxin [Deltaproteobacteria bacterium]|nr:thioredoxin [Deltaproteobacteria bacterium]